MDVYSPDRRCHTRMERTRNEIKIVCAHQRPIERQLRRRMTGFFWFPPRVHPKPERSRKFRGPAGAATNARSGQWKRRGCVGGLIPNPSLAPQRLQGARSTSMVLKHCPLRWADAGLGPRGAKGPRCLVSRRMDWSGHLGLPSLRVLEPKWLRYIYIYIYISYKSKKGHSVMHMM